MKRQEKYPNTKWFKYWNNNPKNRFTGDCVIRAISLATSNNYNEVLKDLYNIQLETGYSIDSNKAIEILMKKYHWIKMNQERKDNNKKYTGKEFCESIAKPNKSYIVNIGSHHITCIKNQQIYDIFDCSNDCVGIYYVEKI